MSSFNLTPIENDSPFPFFVENKEDEEKWYKIYHDGRHFVGTYVTKKVERKRERTRTTGDIDELFDSLFCAALKQGLNDKKKSGEMTDFIRTRILKLFPQFKDIDEYIQRKIKRKYHNLGVRKKRFRRKAFLNRWNYFVTFTFDDKKHTAETFRKKLRRCLSNLKTRRGWRYMGVFECAPETGRLHFHGLIYVPQGEMLGKINEKSDYSTAQGKIQITHENSFFVENFGRNDFTEINEMEITHGHSLEYMLKYIEKQGERIVYSRGIPTEICRKIVPKDIASEFTDFVLKFVLFDDVLSWEKDVMKYEPKQLSFTDLICNPPTAA